MKNIVQGSGLDVNGHRVIIFKWYMTEIIVCIMEPDYFERAIGP